MKITAGDLSELGCMDGVVPEPEGGAHSIMSGGRAARPRPADALTAISREVPLQELSRVTI